MVFNEWRVVLEFAHIELLRMRKMEYMVKSAQAIAWAAWAVPTALGTR